MHAVLKSELCLSFVASRVGKTCMTSIYYMLPISILSLGFFKGKTPLKFYSAPIGAAAFLYLSDHVFVCLVASLIEKGQYGQQLYFT